MSMDLDAMTIPLDTLKNGTRKVKKRKLARDESQSSKKQKRDAPDETAQAAPILTELSSPTPKKKKKKRTESKHQEEVPDIDASMVLLLEELRQPTASPEVNSNGVSDESQPAVDDVDGTLDQLPPSDIPAPFNSIRISLYLPLNAVSLNAAGSSLLSAHLAPLLLTYYAPVQGVVLAFSDPVLSAKPALSSGLPLCPPSQTPRLTPETLALVSDEHGVSWVWLTVTLLVFQPEPGMEMEGYINTCAEGFVGLVSYNYFQTGIPRTRIPGTWKWTAPDGMQTLSRMKKRGKKYKLNDSDGPEDHGTPMALDSPDPHVVVDKPRDEGLGFFVDAGGKPVHSRQILRFKIVGSDVVPVQGKDKSLQIEGTLLSEEEEARVLREEEQKFYDQQNRRRVLKIPGSRASRDASKPVMTGDIGLGREDSIASATPTPRKHRLTY